MRGAGRQAPEPGRGLISFEGATAETGRGSTRRHLLRDASIDLPRRRIAIVAPDPDDQQGLMDLLCRRSRPTSGRILFRGSISWPIGRLSHLTGALKGTDVVSYLCALYDVPREPAMAFMAGQFSDPDLLITRTDRWPSEIRAQFGLLAALLPQFDTYLVDGNLVLPSHPEFMRRFVPLLAERIRGRTVIVSTRQVRILRDLCDCALVIADGQLTLLDDVPAAITLAGPEPRRDAPISDAVDVDDFPF